MENASGEARFTADIARLQSFTWHFLITNSEDPNRVGVHRNEHSKTDNGLSFFQYFFNTLNGINGDNRSKARDGEHFIAPKQHIDRLHLHRRQRENKNERFQTNIAAKLSSLRRHAQTLSAHHKP
jgi:hypothetical protein